MEDVNYLILIGRLTRDAELKYTNSGLAVSSDSIAVNRRKKKGDGWEDEVSFFDIVIFGKRAESLNQYLTKGQQVAVEGSLVQDRWEQDGQKRSKVKILVNNVQLLGGRQNSGGQQQGGQQNNSGGYQQGGNSGYQQSGSSFGSGQNNNAGGSQSRPSDYPDYEDQDIPF